MCFLFAVSKNAPSEEVDAVELTNVGEEWPDFEESNVAVYREFTQVNSQSIASS